MITKLRTLKNHEGFMRYFKNTSWLFGEKIIRMVVGLFVGIWVARYLGPEQFGLFSYVQSFVGLFAAIATLGLDSIVVRELVKDENKRDELMATAFWLKLMGAIVLLIVLAVAINFTSNDSYTNILVFIIASSTIFQTFNVIDMYFQSKVFSKYVVFANMISLLLSSIIKIVLILNEATLIAFAWVVLFESIVLALGYIYFFIKTTRPTKVTNLKFNKITALNLLRDSWPLILAGMALSINQKIDQVMIKEFLGIESVGYYAAAVNLIDVLVVLPFLVSKSIFPSYVQSYAINKERFYKKIILGYRVFLLSLIIPTLFLYFFAKDIILLTYGDDYIKSIEIFQVYCLILIFSSVGAINMIYLRTTNQQKKVMSRQLANVFINIGLNYFLIPRYGTIAAAYTSLASIVITTIVYDLFDKDMKHLNKLKLNSIGL